MAWRLASIPAVVIIMFSFGILLSLTQYIEYLANAVEWVTLWVLIALAIRLAWRQAHPGSIIATAMGIAAYLGWMIPGVVADAASILFDMAVISLAVWIAYREKSQWPAK